MNKMQMAHDMALAIQGTKLLHDMELVSDMAWKYADAMQAEADERNKAEAEQKRKEIREMLNAPNTFIEREGQHFDDVCSDEIHAQRDAELYGCGFLKVTYDENGVKYERINPEIVSICDKNIGLDSEVLKEWQPDWSQAPDGVTGWSMRSDGNAIWHYYYGTSVILAPSFGYTGDWRESQRRRP